MQKCLQRSNFSVLCVATALRWDTCGTVIVESAGLILEILVAFGAKMFKDFFLNPWLEVRSLSGGCKSCLSHPKVKCLFLLHLLALLPEK